MRKRFKRSIREEDLGEPLINLTPLIDVVFVVLISFILVAPFLQIDTLLLAPGSQSEQKKGPSIEQPFAIAIQKDDSLWYKGKTISLLDLEKILSQEKKNHPLIIPQIIPDSRSHFEIYQRVKNAIENAGYSQMDILLKDP
jgi:biopolymer transport protein ExbD